MTKFYVPAGTYMVRRKPTKNQTRLINQTHLTFAWHSFESSKGITLCTDELYNKTSVTAPYTVWEPWKHGEFKQTIYYFLPLDTTGYDMIGIPHFLHVAVVDE